MKLRATESQTALGRTNWPARLAGLPTQKSAAGPTLRKNRVAAALTSELPAHGKRPT